MTGVGGAHRSGAAIGGDPGIGITVAIRHDPRAMDVGDGAHLRDILFLPMDGVVEGKKVLSGKAVRPLHGDGLALASFKRRARPHAVVSPHRGSREITMSLMTKGAQVNGNRCGTGAYYRRN